MKLTKNDVFSLIKEWSDYLLDHQIKELETPLLKGGLLCPACGYIHGRGADLVPALVILYAETGEKRYLEAAELLIDFAENNLLRDHNLYVNETDSVWFGVSAFFAMGLGEILRHYGNILPKQVYDRWYAIFTRIAENFNAQFVKVTNSINYSAGAAGLFALAYNITKEEKYKALAEKYEAVLDSHFDDNDILYGEWSNHDYVTKKGCRGIDMGYNIEESLQILIQYCVWMQDEEKLEKYCKRALAHLDFIMPDGGIDNSFGTRNAKWTYWGSRTTDGIWGGFSLVTGRDKRFAKAAALSFELVKRCTVDGAFYGGPMMHDYGEFACVHHAFTHAKSLAFMYINMQEKDFENLEEIVLPREVEYGIKDYQNGYLKLVSVGGMRATISALDALRAQGSESFGGNLNLLWHKEYGPICAATMHFYRRTEVHNMQSLRQGPTECMTPRIICGEYSNDTDKTVEISSSGDKNKAEVTVIGNNELNFKIVYTFVGDELEMTITCEKDSLYKLPIIADKKAEIKLISQNEINFRNMLTVTASAEIKTEDLSKRYFNQVGGFEYLPLEIPLKANETVKVKFTVK